MTIQISKRLKDFIKKERGNYNFPLTEGRTLSGDLGIYGDDADDFFIAFSKEFQVDISNFEIGNYFRGEGDFIIAYIRIFFTNKEKKISNYYWRFRTSYLSWQAR